MAQPVKVTGKIRLSDFDPAYTGGLKKEQGVKKTDALCQSIGELQDLLYANRTHSLVILLQGMDCSGKDGAAKRVLEFVDPIGVETTSFKAPSEEEKAHDYLWRVHKATPRFGNIGLFNRSHYEEVLIVRVFNHVQLEKIKLRYEQINAFEKMLTENNVVLLKFFLHISKEEQRERLQARIDDPQKHWKFSSGDLEMRKRWDDFQKAYEDAINACNSAWAPWHIIPADKKWYRSYAIANVVAEKLKSLKMGWPKAREDLSKIKIV